MQDDDLKKAKTEGDDEEYANVAELNDIEGKDGDQVELDHPEEGQDPVTVAEELESPREQLEKAITGDDNDPDELYNE